jgi:uncharacterized membrane protein
MTGIEGLIPHIKALHLAFLAVWMAGLIAVPRILAFRPNSRNSAAPRTTAMSG